MARPALYTTDFNFRDDDTVDTFETAKCRGVDPTLFEVNPRLRGERLQNAAWIALSTCSTCPLRGLRGACVQWVKPAESDNNIIAGGWVWIMGQPILSHTGETNEHSLDILDEGFDEAIAS
jgi:hypothetical protein